MENIRTKESDSRATPYWLKAVFSDWFDPCPLNPNPEIDGLKLEWPDKTFVNPPYSCPANKEKNHQEWILHHFVVRE